MNKSEIVTNLIKDLIKDLHAKQILIGTFFRSKSVRELSEKYDIPFTICSEKVQALERLGMLVGDDSTQIHDEGHIKYYRSDLPNSHVIYKPDNIYFRFEIMPNYVKSYPRWITIDLL